MKNTVIHHRADFDGLFCREIAKKFLPPDTEFIGWHYGDPPVPFPAEGTVYVLDLSPECFGKNLYILERVVWIDHHASAIKKFDSSLAGYRIDGVAACRLAWQWFIHLNSSPDFRDFPLPKKEMFVNRVVAEPVAVRLAGEYDVWDKRDPDAELFQFGLRSREISPLYWRGLLDESEETNVNFVTELLRNGHSIQFAKTKENRGIITSYGFDLKFEGLTFLACNHARHNSQLFTAGLKPHHDACMGFKWTGKFWEFSLYHATGKEDIDLSVIAAKHGGGGHRGACGFRVNGSSPPDFLLKVDRCGDSA